MSPDNSLRTRALRMLMAMDATVLGLLGIAFVFSPTQIEAAFQFKDLPPAVNFFMGLWGCALITLGLGYGIAAADPYSHRLWVFIGILRGGLEAIFGWWCYSREMVTWKQAGLGILLPAFIAIAYAVLFPRKESEDL